MVGNQKESKNSVKIKDFLLKVFFKTKSITLDLFKIMIPIILSIKILQEINILDYIVLPFNYIMQIVGLPEIYALAWIGAIFNTSYVAMTLIAVFFQEHPLTVEQVSVLGIMILISHALFIEGVIVHKLRLNAFFNTILRLSSSFIVGYLVHISAQYFGWMQEEATSPFYIETEIYGKTVIDLYNAGVLSSDFNIWFKNILLWFYSQLKTFCLIAIVIYTIFSLVQLLKDFNVVGKIDSLFKPFFSIMKISKKNYTATSICYLIGLSYGYGVLKEERDNSKFFRRDQPFKVVTFLSLAHAIIEEGLIFVLLGASPWVVVLGRTLWGLVITIILSWLILPRLSTKNKHKYLYKK